MWRLALSLSVSLVACNGDDDTTPTTPTDDTGAELTHDVIVQELVSPIDILWVVDPGWNEGMDGLEEALESGYETLLLADPSWRFGALDATVDPASNQFGVITSKFETWPPPANAFNFGTADGPPHVRDVIYAALELRREQQANAEFIRSDAHLYVLVYTNKEDQSEDEAVKSRAAWRDWFAGYQPSDSARLGGVVDGDVTNYWREQIVGDATIFTAGSLRSGVPTQLREAMGQKTEFVLSQVPTAPLTKVSVVYREREEIFEEPAFTFSNSRNSVTFTEYVPPPDSEVHVIYASDPALAETTPTTPATPPAE
jgi:hypothetical protein